MGFDANQMMIDLFRGEVESHSESLTESLLALERAPSNTSVVDGMMRAAHSIKGAARIVQIQPAVDVAHVMEDCFVAAQREQIVLQSDHVDTLLQGVDLLSRIAEATKDEAVNWSDFDSDVQLISVAIRSILLGESAPHAVAKQPTLSAQQLEPTITDALPAAPVNSVLKTDSSRKDSQAHPELLPAATSSPSEIPPSIQPNFQTIVAPELLTEATSETLRAQFAQAVNGQASSIEINLRNLKDFNAIGLATLAAIGNYSENNSTLKLQFVDVPATIQTVFEVAGLTKIKPFRDLVSVTVPLQSSSQS